MKLKKLILLAAAVTVMTAGCGNGAESSGPASDVTSVYVTREGAVTSVTVEEYDTEAFEDDEAGLLASVTEDLEAWRRGRVRGACVHPGMHDEGRRGDAFN